MIVRQSLRTHPKNQFFKWFRCISNLLFPPTCVHCHHESPFLFCKGCAAYFELINPLSHCPFCFAENESRGVCSECFQKKRRNIRIGAALDYVEPVQTFLRKMKYRHMPYLVKTAAAFMFIQFERLGWECPDIIVPVPPLFWFQGNHHVLLIAKALAKQLDVKVCSCVKQQIQGECFYLKKRVKVKNPTILIVDDVMLTHNALHHTAEVLKECFPKKIYSLTLASAVHVN